MAECPISDADHVDKVVSAASKAQSQWAQKTPLERGKVLKKAADIIRVGSNFSDPNFLIIVFTSINSFTLIVQKLNDFGSSNAIV